MVKVLLIIAALFPDGNTEAYADVVPSIEACEQAAEAVKAQALDLDPAIKVWYYCEAVK